MERIEDIEDMKKFVKDTKSGPIIIKERKRELKAINASEGAE
jgi:hypothetical protein